MLPCEEVQLNIAEELLTGDKEALTGKQLRAAMSKLTDLSIRLRDLRVQHAQAEIEAIETITNRSLSERQKLTITELSSLLVPDLTGVLSDVYQERKNQDRKWGSQRHHPLFWNVILGEERGEVERAIYEATMTQGDNSVEWDHYRTELVQLAAVTVHVIQSYDENLKADHDTPVVLGTRFGPDSKFYIPEEPEC